MQSCDATFAGTDVGPECPISCDMCPGVCGDGIYDWDEDYLSCPQDVPGCGENGCDPCSQPDKTLSILADGTVLYNSSQQIAGFEFKIEGATIAEGWESASVRLKFPC